MVQMFVCRCVHRRKSSACCVGSTTNTCLRSRPARARLRDPDDNRRIAHHMMATAESEEQEPFGSEARCRRLLFACETCSCCGKQGIAKPAGVEIQISTHVAKLAVSKSEFRTTFAKISRYDPKKTKFGIRTSPLRNARWTFGGRTHRFCNGGGEFGFRTPSFCNVRWEFGCRARQFFLDSEHKVFATPFLYNRVRSHFSKGHVRAVGKKKEVACSCRYSVFPFFVSCLTGDSNGKAIDICEKV